MISTTHKQRRELEQLSRQNLTSHQLDRLNQLLQTVLPENQFYREKLGQEQLRLNSLGELSELPFTYKDELIGAHTQADWAIHHTFAPEKYNHFHRTSGTRGHPLAIMDTAEDWQWWIDSWQFVLDAADITTEDRALMAFSFGPFIGFWSAYDAVVARGAMTIPTGGMNSLARLELLKTSAATALFCTPSYALRLVEIAHSQEISLADNSITKIVVAGEPGGSLPSVRSAIESQWQAKVIDHSGATEIGPWGYGDSQGAGLYVLESEFIAEFISLESGQPAMPNELSELVLTNVGRTGSPVIRYRTGDLVKPVWDYQAQQGEVENRFVHLSGGILGRADDMLIIRGVNIFPSSIEQIIRSFPEIVEYRLIAYKEQEMDQLRVEIEDHLEEPSRVANELYLRLGLNVEVILAPLGSLPRFEGKGDRFTDRRSEV